MTGIISEKEINDFLSMKTEELDPSKRKYGTQLEDKDYHSVQNHIEYILGNPWRVMLLQDSDVNDWKGRCSTAGSRIIQLNLLTIFPEQVGDVYVDLERVIRHEVIHAYTYEAGIVTVSGCTPNWATNEMTVDWFAYQMPKIMETSENISKVISPTFKKFYEMKKEDDQKTDETRKKDLEKKLNDGLITQSEYDVLIAKLKKGKETKS